MNCKCGNPMFYDSEGCFYGCSCGLMYGDLDTVVPGWSDEKEKMEWLRMDYRFKNSLEI